MTRVLRSPKRLWLAIAGAFAAALAIPGTQAADPLPQSAEELIRKRAQMGPRGDMFGARSWAPPRIKLKAATPQEVLPPPPQPPALPFSYGGSGVVNGKAVLFLDRQHRSVMVGIGEVVEGMYRVEAVERNRAVLRYLPLDVAQVMAFGSAGAVAQPAVPAVPPLARGPLFVNVPGELPLGRELPVALGIPPGSAAAKATIEITYDADALSISGAKILRPGRALVEVNATPTPSKHVHLKAIAEEAVQTEIGIEVIAFDAQGKSVEIRGLPAQHIISLGDTN
jgi:hypothetical protein